MSIRSLSRFDKGAPVSPGRWRMGAALVLALFVGACRGHGAPSGDGPLASVSSVAAAPSASAALADPNERCRRRRVCRYHGRCSAGEHRDDDSADGDCSAASDEDCLRSQGCKDWGLCHAWRGVCQAGDDEHCRSAWICRTKGHCSARDGHCVVRDDKDCRRAELCKYARKCSAQNGRCIRD